MFELMIPAALVAVVGYAVLRRGGPAASARTPAAAVPPLARPTWPDAASESDMLRIAVDQMQDHRDLIIQGTEGWLMGANHNAVDPNMFRQNLLEADGMIRALDEECEAVVAELRDFERKRTQTHFFAERKDRAEAFIAWAKAQHLELDSRLKAVASSAGLEVEALKTEAAKRSGAKTLADVEALLPRFVDPTHLPLRSVLP